MTGFDTFRIVTAIKMHYSNKSYDVFKYNFKAKHLNQTSFEKRKDRYFFEKLSKRFREEKDLISFTFANVLYSEKNAAQVWVRDMNDEFHQRHTKYIQSFGYTLKNELKSLPQMPLDSLLRAKGNNIPILVHELLKGSVKPETVITIDLCTNFTKVLQDVIVEKMLWPDISLKIMKSCPFIRREVNLDKAKKILFDHFRGLQTSEL